MQRVPNRDPNRLVAAFVYNEFNSLLGVGVNQILALSTAERWADKYRWVCHAEEVAIHEAYRCSPVRKPFRLWTNYFPCARCANHIVLAGIKQVEAPEPDLTHHRWGPDWAAALAILKENNVSVAYTTAEATGSGTVSGPAATAAA